MKPTSQKGSNLSTLSPYPVRYRNNGTEGHFISDNSINYLLSFTQNEGEPNNSLYGDACVTVGLYALSGYVPTGSGKRSYDERVELTVMGELIRLFNASPVAVVYFSCDTAGGYEKSRHKLFGIWYDNHLAPLGILRKQYSDESQRIYASMYYRPEHPFREEVERDFDLLLHGK
ncbi:DUF6169 family protein [Spirosoma luteolum]